MAKLKEMNGLVFGRLTVLSLSPSNKRGAYWNCRCECGIELSVRGWNLRCGSAKSCGCLQREKVAETGRSLGGSKNYAWKGGGNNPGSEAWVNIRISGARLRARNLGYADPSFTATEVVQRYSQRSGRCAICGVPEAECTRSLAIDHCHKTGAFRGFLCSNCNNGLGIFKDNPALLKKAADYLTANIIKGSA